VIGIGCIGGSIEEGESPVEALKREALEEIGCSVDLRSAGRTAYIRDEAVEILPELDFCGLQPAIVWEVTDPSFQVGSNVSVFLGQADDNPQPIDLPAIILADPGVISMINFESVSVDEILKSGAEIRQNIDIPRNGRLILANTLRRLMLLHADHRELFDEFTTANPKC
jgi:hypothetical protein